LSNYTKLINIALQGGGAHGALVWGILDKFLEDGRIRIEAISATSAGSMNGVMYSYGLHKGGRDGAREAFINFGSVSVNLVEFIALSILFPGSASRIGGKWIDLSGTFSLRASPVFYLQLSLIRLI
jgi:NTE family protein